jgi:small subunit ribosomal protein S11
MAKSTKTSKKRVVRVDSIGRAYIMASFNNIIISLTNDSGHVVSWSSAGKMGFKGSKKNTPYAAQIAATDCSKVAFDLGMRKVLEVLEIEDITPLPHNGCRPPKRRRV